MFPDVNRIYDIRVAGHKESLKALETLTKAFEVMDNTKRKLNENLKKAIDVGNTTAVEKLTGMVADLEKKLKNLDQQRQKSAKEVELLARAEKLQAEGLDKLAAARLKESQATLNAEKANAVRMSSMIEQERELERLIALEEKEKAARDKAAGQTNNAIPQPVSGTQIIGTKFTTDTGATDGFLTGLKSKLKELELEFASLSKSSVDFEERQKTLGTQIVQVKQEISDFTSVTKLQRQASEESISRQITDEYKLLNQSLRDAETRYKNLYIVKGKDHDATQQALKDALGIRKILDDIDTSLGNYQRKVGQYAGEFTKAFDTIKGEIAKLRTEQQGLQNLAARNPIGFTIGDQDRLNRVTSQLQTLEQVERIGFQTTQSYAEQVRNLDAAYEHLVSSGAQNATVQKELQTVIQKTRAGSQQASKEFNNLKLSMSQILREAPSLAVGLQTFILGISNNLDQFRDAIEKTKAANNELAANGQKPVSVLSQIGKSLFSVQSLFTIGVTLLTLFGSKLIDWAGSLFKASDATDQLDRDLKILNDTLRTTKEGFEKVNTEIDNLAERRRISIELQFIGDPSKAGLINTRRDLGDLADKAQQAEIAYRKAGQTVIDIQNKIFETQTSDDRELFDAANLSTNADISEEVFNKLSKSSQKLVTSYKEAVKQQDEFGKKTTELRELYNTGQFRVQLEEARFTKQQQDKAADDAKEAADKQREIAERNAKAVFEIKKFYLEKDIAFEKAFASSDTTSAVRVSARQQQFEKERELIDVETDYELSTGKKTAKEIELIILQRNDKVRSLESQLATDVIQIRSTVSKSIIQEALDYAAQLEAGMNAKKQKEVDDLTKGFEREQQAFETSKNKRLTTLNNEYKEGKVSKDKYEKEKQKIEQDALIKSLDNQLAYYNSLVKLYEFDVEKKREALDKIAALEAARSAIGLPGSGGTAGSQKQLALPGQTNFGDLLKQQTKGKVSVGKDSEGNDVDGSDLLGNLLADSYGLAELAMNSYYDSERARIEESKELTYKRIDLEKEQKLALAQSQNEKDAIEKEATVKKEKADREAGQRLKQLKKSEARIALSTELANIAVAAAQNPLNGITFGAAGIALYALLSGLALARYALNVRNIESQQFAGGGQVKPSKWQKVKQLFTGGAIPKEKDGYVLATVKTNEMILSPEEQQKAGGPATFKRIGVPGVLEGKSNPVELSDTNVVPPVLSSGKITTRPNIPTQKNGDNTLVYLRPGHMILNETQQERLRKIKGYASGGVVPGYATGGVLQPSFGGLTFGDSLQAPINPSAFLNNNNISGSDAKKLFEAIKNQSEIVDKLAGTIGEVSSQTNQRIDKIKVQVVSKEVEKTNNDLKKAESVGKII